MPTLKKLPSSLRKDLSGSLSQCNPLVISSAPKLLDYVLKQTRYYSHIAFLSTCLGNRIIPNGLQSTFRPSQFGPNSNDCYIQNIQILQKCFSRDSSNRHSQQCTSISWIHNLNSRFYSALLDTENRKYSKLTGACHPTQATSNPQIPNPTQDLPHNVSAAIGHVATFRALTDSTDDVTSAAAGYATSSTVNTINTAADAAASISEADTTDIEDAAPAANIQDLPAYAAPPTAEANVSLPTAYHTPPTADIAPPTASTASSSRGDNSTQP
eukprot:g19105.t1